MPTETRKQELEDEEVKSQILVSADDDVEFGDESMMTVGDGFNKISPPDNDKSKVVRYNLLSDFLKPKKAWGHFVTGKGLFRCLSERDKVTGIITKAGVCCKKLNGEKDRQKAQLAALVLAFWYKNVDPKTGLYPTGSTPIDWEIGYVKYSKSGFRRVSNLRQEDHQIHDFDLKSSWKLDGVGLEYTILAQNARFRKNPALFEEVKEAIQPFLDGKMLTKKLGKVVTEIEFLAMLSAAPAKNSSDANVDDVSNL